MTPGDADLTPKQIEELQAAFNAMTGDPAWKHKVVWLPPNRDINTRAAAFAKQHGSFALLFDAGQNYVKPDDAPWAVQLDNQPDQGWAGFTAEEAIENAASELARQGSADEPPEDVP